MTGDQAESQEVGIDRLLTLSDAVFAVALIALANLFYATSPMLARWTG